jgi:hypothetical protein
MSRRAVLGGAAASALAGYPRVAAASPDYDQLLTDVQTFALGETSRATEIPVDKLKERVKSMDASEMRSVEKKIRMALSKNRDLKRLSKVAAKSYDVSKMNDAGVKTATAEFVARILKGEALAMGASSSSLDEFETFENPEQTKVFYEGVIRKLKEDEAKAAAKRERQEQRWQELEEARKREEEQSLQNVDLSFAF